MFAALAPREHLMGVMGVMLVLVMQLLWLASGLNSVKGQAASEHYQYFKRVYPLANVFGGSIHDGSYPACYAHVHLATAEVIHHVFDGSTQSAPQCRMGTLLPAGSQATTPAPPRSTT
jgi:hypothetical protein